MGWVTVRGYTNLGIQPSHQGLLSLAIPPWVGAMSIQAMVSATAREKTASSV